MPYQENYTGASNGNSQKVAYNECITEQSQTEATVEKIHDRLNEITNRLYLVLIPETPMVEDSRKTTSYPSPIQEKLYSIQARLDYLLSRLNI